jgi:hypothetical protein
MPERQVVFYECQNVENHPDFNRVAALQDINDMDDDDWRVSDYDNEMGVIVDQVGDTNTPSELRFLRIRPDAPYKLSAARELSLVEVEDDENISEFTYVVMWPDGFMAALSSRDAPSHKKLGRYFRQTSGEETHIVNLFVEDVVERLRELRRNGLRNVKFKVQTANVVQIEADQQATGFKGFFDAGKQSHAATIGIEISVGRARRAHLSDDIAEAAEELAEMGDLLESMIVKGRNDDDEVKTINMKQERIRGTIELDGTATARDYYRAIREVRRSIEGDTGPLDRSARGT